MAVRNDPFALAFAAAAQAAQQQEQVAEEAAPPPAPPIESTLFAADSVFGKHFYPAQPVPSAVTPSQQSDEDSLLQEISNLRERLEKKDNQYKLAKKENKSLCRHLLESHRQQAEMRVEIQALKNRHSVDKQRKLNNKENERKTSSWTRTMR